VQTVPTVHHGTLAIITDLN